MAPGSRIRFDQNCTLVSEGTLKLIGTNDLPIILEANTDLWGGILLANANKQSIFQNVIFRNISGVGKDQTPKGWSKMVGL